MSPQYYKSNDEEKPGIALIFNQVHFPPSQGKSRDRDGTNHDRDRLIEVLRIYGFDINCYEDLKASKIKQKLKKVSTADHTNTSSLLIVIMSHGNGEEIETKRGNIKISQILKTFYEDNCSGLVGKPKLFFILACRGNAFDFGPDSKLNTNIVEKFNIIPEEKDFFVFYSTYGGCRSIRVGDGSWFIQEICNVLQTGANGIELNNFATKVSERVASNEYPMDDEGTVFKQMPVRYHTLTKRYCFKKTYAD